MAASPPEPVTSNVRGYLLAGAIGVTTVVISTAIFVIATDKPATAALDPGLLFQMLIVSVPFGLLSRAGIWDRRVWFLGLILTVAFWGYYLFEGIQYQLTDKKGGVNMGLALILVFGSPVIISVVCFIAAKILRKVS